MRLKLICAVLVGVLVIAPGCGSKKKSTTTKTTTPTTTTSASGGSNLTSEECANLLAAGSTVTNASSGKLPSNIAAQVASLNALAKVAPASVKADLETLAAAASSLTKLHLTPGQTKLTPAQTQQLMQLMAKVDLVKLGEAGKNVAAWANKVCTKN